MRNVENIFYHKCAHQPSKGAHAGLGADQFQRLGVAKDAFGFLFQTSHLLEHVLALALVHQRAHADTLLLGIAHGGRENVRAAGPRPIAF